MTIEPRLLSRAQVAQLLGQSLDWFARNHKILTIYHSFPAKVPGCGDRWDREAIHRWLDGFMEESTTKYFPAPAGHPPVPLFFRTRRPPASR